MRSGVVYDYSISIPNGTYFLYPRKPTNVCIRIHTSIRNDMDSTKGVA